MSSRTPPPGPHAPYGWRRVAGRLVEDPEEQDTIEVIVAARRYRKSYREVAAWLTHGARRKPRAGGQWHPSLIAAVLRRELGATRPRAVSMRRRRRAA